jgi:hypothetical protein
MDEKLELIISYLNKVKTRCTYGVVAEIIGTNSQSVGKRLGERRPEASWVVNASTGDPTGYSDSEKHPELYRTDRIIESAEVLRRNIGV